MNKRLKLVAMGCAVIALLMSLITVQTSPTAWQDESQILAFGAGFLDSAQGKDYVLNNANESKPAFCFVGAALSFLTWITIPGVFGHRYLMLLIALMSSGLIYLLTRRRLGDMIAMLLAGAWIFEPSLCQSYRGGRLDILAFFFILSSLFFWQARKKETSSKMRNTLVMLSGMSLMMAQLTWISTILCLPFLFVVLFIEFERGNQSYTSLGREILLFGLGGCLLAFVVFLMASEHLSEAMTVMVEAPKRQTSAERFDNSFTSLFAAGKWSIATLLTALASIGVASQNRERIVLFMGTLVTLGLVILTRAYVHRFIYALPMLFLCIYVGMGNGFISNRARLLSIGLLLCVGMAISGVARNLNAIHKRNNRDYSSVTAMIDQLNVQRGDRVYDATWQLYLASKNRFQPVRYWGNPYGVDLNAETNAMAGCDWIFLPVNRPDSVARFLSELGFEESFHSTPSFAYGPYSVWQLTERGPRNR